MVQNNDYIGFNKPYLTGQEQEFIADAVRLKKLSGNGKYTILCQQFFEQNFGFKKCLLTTSCTDALEMCALLLNIQLGDEVIMPSYTFVSTANAFVLRGAKIVFCDSNLVNPNIDSGQIERLITSKTKAIVVVHYAGVACDMDNVMSIANRHNLFVVEDAAQAIDSYYKDRPLGSIGHLATFSFHETKNISSGEGGMLVINDTQFINRAEILWEKGTNRVAFFKGQVDKYNWVDIGSSYLPSEITAAFLYAQIIAMEDIQSKRKKIWHMYFEHLSEWATFNKIRLPQIPVYATNNAHMFYLVCSSPAHRTEIINSLQNDGIMAVFHYLSLHNSPFYIEKHDNRVLKESDNLSSTLIRLPMFYDLSETQITKIIKSLTTIRLSIN